MSAFVQTGKDLCIDEEEILASLVSHGFSEKEIQAAYDWVLKVTLDDQLKRSDETKHISSPRVFDAEETYRFTPEARGFLWRLRSAGIITDLFQEEIINKLLALDSEEISLKDVSHIAALTIFPKMSNLFDHEIQPIMESELNDSGDPLH